MTESPSFEPTYRIADDRAGDPAAFATDPSEGPPVDHHARDSEWGANR